MIKSLFSTLGSLQKGYLLSTGLKVLLITILVFGGIFTAFTVGFGYIGASSSAEEAITFFGGILGMVAGYFMTPLLLPIVSILFLDEVAEKVEQREYPELAKLAKSPGLLETLMPGIQFVLLTIILNLLIVPFLIFPPLHLMLYYLLNGYLFGREYFELVASRYYPMKDIKRVRKEHSGKLWLAGMLLAVGYTIPIVNLFLPLLATVYMIHLYVYLRGETAGHKVIEHQNDKRDYTKPRKY